MTEIERIFKERMAENKKVLIPYVMGCYPSEKLFTSTLIATTEAGADLIEVGFPFSDPLADGVSIQNASEIALKAGVNADDIFKATASINGRVAPLIFMTYYNVVYKYGLDKFLDKAKKSGFCGAIIPDMPLEEKAEFTAKAAKRGIDTVFLLAPTSTESRINETSKAAFGFIYCVSLTGVTGARTALSSDLPTFIKKVQKRTSLPLAIGFGISTPAQAAQACKLADGAIVGSAFINEITRLANISGKNDQFSKGITKFISSFRTAIDGKAHRDKKEPVVKSKTAKKKVVKREVVKNIVAKSKTIKGKAKVK